MHILVILAVLAALASAESASAVPISGGIEKSIMALGGIATVVLFARMAAISTCLGLHRDFERRHVFLRRFRWLRRVHLALWLVTVSIILFGLQWASIVRANWRLAETFLADELLILAPVLLPLVLSWAAFFEVENALHLGFARDAGMSADPLSRLRYVGFHIRHFLGLLFTPLLLILAVHDAAEWIRPGLLTGPYAWAVLAVPLAAIVVVFPWLLRVIWQAQPLPDGALRDRLLHVNRRCGVSVKQILVWRSGEMVTNAAVAGILPSIRYVFLSDGLLARMSDDQVVAVYAHEIGHVRHGHLTLRVIAMIVPVLFWYQLAALASGCLSSLDGTFAAASLAEPSRLLLAVGMAIYFVTVFAWYARLLEHQADLTACRVLTAASSLDSATIAVDATDRFADALMWMTPGGTNARRRGGLLHPGFDRRVDFLRRVAAYPADAEVFEQRMCWLARFLFLIFLLSGTAAIVAA